MPVGLATHLPLKNWKTRSVSVTLWPLPFTLKISILLQKKNYGNSNNISPCKNYNLPKKNPPKILQDISQLYN
jgi:hypothetical protein